MVLCQKPVDCPLRVGVELLSQAKEFKYLRVLFTSEGKMERETDRWIGAASAVLRALYQSVMVKKALSRKVKLSIFQSIYVTALTYGHELWVMIERMKLWIQADEMSFLRRVARLSFRDRVRRSELLLLRVKRSLLRWFGHLIRVPLVGGLLGTSNWQEASGQTQNTLEDYIAHAAWEHQGVPQDKLVSVAGDRDIWKSLLSLLPLRPGPR